MFARVTSLHCCLFTLQVSAHDDDTGQNAEIRYHILSGAFNEFSLDNVTGELKLSSSLDYDRRSNYSIAISAVDEGIY